jgi:hypothetical protein
MNLRHGPTFSEPPVADLDNHLQGKAVATHGQRAGGLTLHPEVCLQAGCLDEAGPRLLTLKKEQSFDLQLDALRKAGCKKIYQETVSGAKAARLQLDLMLDNLRAGDVLAYGNWIAWAARYGISSSSSMDSWEREWASKASTILSRISCGTGIT